MPSKLACQDLIYYNVIIPHSGNTNFTIADYNRMNTVPILDTPEDYYLSVSRFSVPTRNIPILIVKPVTPNSELLNYTVTLTSSEGAFEVTKNIRYFSTSAGSTPSNPLHYFVYTYTHFVKMLNDTLAEAMVDLKALDISIPVGAVAPRVLYIPELSLFSLVAQKQYYGEEVLPANKINFYSNQYLFKLLDPLMVDFFSASLSVDKSVRYYFFDKGNNTWAQDSDYWFMSQDYSIISTWSSLRSIEMEVGTIPVNYEFIEHDYESLNKQTTSAPVLKDYLVLYRDSNQAIARTTVDYSVEDTQYICLSGVEPLRELSIRLYWVDNFGKRYRLTLSEGDTISIKLLFKRKDLAY